MTVKVPSEVRRIRSHRDGVANSCELPNMGVGNQTPALYKSRLFYTALLSLLSTPTRGVGQLCVLYLWP